MSKENQKEQEIAALREAALHYHEFPTPGKIEIAPTKQLTNQRDLALAYTPGVAAPCEEIVKDPANAFKYTARGNLVGVITNGTAVLGLGNIGPLASKPVMEGKAVLFKKFAGIDVFDIEINETDPEKLVEIIASLEPTFGGINLEDIKAPDCFIVERKLQARMKIPVFHDDQHGTAIVVLAALTNALKLVGKKPEDLHVVMSGAGAAGTAIAQLLAEIGITNIVAYDSRGAVYEGRPDSARTSEWMLAHTNKEKVQGSLGQGLAGADVFIGVSAPNLLTEQEVASMAPNAIVFALANPDPEIDPTLAAKHATVVATGRSDFPNQINNVLAFPGFFRGLLDAGSKEITTEMLLAAANAIAECVTPDQLNASFIVPSVFDPNVAKRVAQAVERVATSN